MSELKKMHPIQKYIKDHKFTPKQSSFHHDNNNHSIITNKQIAIQENKKNLKRTIPTKSRKQNRNAIPFENRSKQHNITN